MACVAFDVGQRCKEEVRSCHILNVSALVTVKVCYICKAQKFLAGRCEMFKAKDELTILKEEPHEELCCDYNSLVV